MLRSPRYLSKARSSTAAAAARTRPPSPARASRRQSANIPTRIAHLASGLFDLRLFIRVHGVQCMGSASGPASLGGRSETPERVTWEDQEAGKKKRVSREVVARNDRGSFPIPKKRKKKIATPTSNFHACVYTKKEGEREGLRRHRESSSISGGGAHALIPSGQKTGGRKKKQKSAEQITQINQPYSPGLPSRPAADAETPLNARA